MQQDIITAKRSRRKKEIIGIRMKTAKLPFGKVWKKRLRGRFFFVELTPS